MAELDWRAGAFNPEAADIGNAFAQGMGLAHQSRKMDMQQQQFDSAMQDKAEMRNAMAEYGAAQDDESRRSAMAKVGVVSPEMYARLDDNFRKAKKDEREVMADAIEQRGMAAYQALQLPSEKRGEFWNQYRNSLPEDIRRGVPADVDDLTLNAVMAQSAAAMDHVNKIGYLKEQGELYRQRDERQYGMDVNLENIRTGNRLGEEGVKQSGRVELQQLRNEYRSGENQKPPSVASLNTYLKGLNSDLESYDPESPEYADTVEEIAATRERIRSLSGINIDKQSNQKTVVRTGTDKSGRKVVQYSDGTVSYAE